MRFVVGGAALVAVTTVIGFAAATADAGSYARGDALHGAPTALAGAHPTILQQLWRSDRLNQIADDIVGATDMVVASEDDAAEWASFFPPGTDSQNVLGFVILGDPSFWHVIFLSPDVYQVFSNWLSTGATAGNEYPFAVAAMSLVHESFHWRLDSGDESTVNACALKYLPTYLSTEFGVPATITQTTTQQMPVTTTTTKPVKHVKYVNKRVKVHGKWKTKRVKITTTTYTTVTRTTYQPQSVTTDVPNPEFQSIVGDANDFYVSQPPPYNAGTCSI
jgi:hypothetical protein